MSEKEKTDTPSEANRPGRRPFRGDATRRPATPLIKLLAMDKDILHLVARRARLLKAAYAGPQPAAGPEPDAERPRPAKEKHAGGSRPSERTKVEKALREAWQAEAAQISPDPRLARELFALLQDISIPGHAGTERPKADGFQLSPPRRPVKVDLPGPVSRFETAVWLALASAVGAELRIENAPLGDHTIDLLKSFNQVSGQLAWEADNVLLARAGGSLDFSDAVIFVGNEPLAVWLMAFLAAPRLGKIKFMGGPDVKSLDFTPLRQFAPQLGARLAPVVPGGKGLPARLECSGMLPDTITVPAALPAEALTGLLILAATWNVAIAIDCSAHPDAAGCRARALPLLAACGARVKENGDGLLYTPGPLEVPAKPRLGMDSFLVSSFLALPAFAGGEAKLSGHWDATLPENRAWANLLRGAGLEISRADAGLTSKRLKNAPAERTIDALQCADLPEEALPLILALAAHRAAPDGVCAVDLPPLSAHNALVTEEFLGRLGCLLEMPEEADAPARIRSARANRRTDGPQDASPWAAPSAGWAIGLALGAYVRPGLSLSNPGCLTEILPAFWQLYNSLPEPKLPAPAPAAREPEAAKPARRRIIASGPE